MWKWDVVELGEFFSSRVEQFYYCRALVGKNIQHDYFDKFKKWDSQVIESRFQEGEEDLVKWGRYY